MKPKDKIMNLDEHIHKLMDMYNTPGISISVVDEFKVQWSKGYGICELGTHNYVDENTLFQAGSVSKTVFSFAVMRLVQEGLLSLDEDINNYLISWKVPKTHDNWTPKVTLRQILSHTAGFTQIGFVGYKQTEKVPNILDILNGLPCSQNNPIIVDTMPGLQYRYSGGGYTVAQQVVTDVLKIPFSQFIEDKVLKPVGMNNSCYEHPLSQKKASHSAFGYRWNNEPVEGGWYNMPFLACAGLWSCSTDLAKFGIEIQKAVNDESKLLKKEYALQMITPNIEDHYGLGIRIWGEKETQQIYHYGGNQGFMSVLMLYRELGKGAAIMINSNHEELLDEILLLIADLYDWPSFMLNEISINKIFPKDMIGNYRTKNGTDIQILMNENGFLQMKYGIQEPKLLTSPNENKCILRPLNTEVEFIKNIDGNIELAIIQQFKRHIAKKIS